MSWPVAERASSRRIWLTSSSVGVIFSIVASTMWTRGSVCVRSPLPSLVTITEVPVSAIRKFAPVMPTSAARKRSRSTPRASLSSDTGSVRSRSGGQIGVDAAEVRLDLRLGQMHRRRDDVARRLVAKLDDVFAEVGLDRLDAVRLEVFVEPDLLGDHRLALGDGARADPPADGEDQVAGVRGGLGVVHLAAGFASTFSSIGLEVEVEMGERVVLDVAGAVAERARTRAGPRPACARFSMKPDCDVLERLLQLRRRRERRRAFSLKLGEVISIASAHWPSPIAGASVMPASTSATWRVVTGMPWRCSLPAMFIRQPRSPASSVPAPEAAIAAVLLLDDGVGDVGILDAERAAEAAADVGVLQFGERQPATDFRSRRGWSRTPSSRRPEQESW